MPVLAIHDKMFSKGGFFSNYHQRFFALDAVSGFLLKRQHLMYCSVICQVLPSDGVSSVEFVCADVSVIRTTL